MGNLRFGEYEEEAAAQEQEELDSKGAEFFKLKEGRSVIRILPPPPGEKSPFKIVYQHFVQLPGGVGRSVVCARLAATNKGACEVCNRVNQLKASKSKLDRDMADAWYAKRRVFFNMIDRKNPEKGPQVLACGKQVHEQIIAFRRDPDAGADFTHPISGFDIIIEREGSGKTDTRYKVLAARAASPLAKTEDQMQEWIDTQQALERFAKLPDKDAIAQLFNADGSEAEVADATPPPRQLSGATRQVGGTARPAAQPQNAVRRTVSVKAPTQRVAADDLEAIEDEA